MQYASTAENGKSASSLPYDVYSDLFGIPGSLHPVNQNVQPLKLAQGISSAVTSSIKTPGTDKTTKPTISSAAQPSDPLLHEGIEM